MASGSGRTLGRALADLFAPSGRAGAARATYDRQGWQAQFSQLTKTKAGYAAMERAGVSATVRTQRNWLSGTTTASKDVQGRIAAAYAAMAGGWNPRWETSTFKISGQVTQGADSRDRGNGRHAPLRIEGSSGIWANIKAQWEFEATADPDTIEALFITDVVNRDLGEGSWPWEFDGTWYEVTA